MDFDRLEIPGLTIDGGLAGFDIIDALAWPVAIELSIVVAIPDIEIDRSEIGLYIDSGCIWLEVRLVLFCLDAGHHIIPTFESCVLKQVAISLTRKNLGEAFRAVEGLAVG